ncbi:TetR/AcrR family transcriptional regulator [Pseudonocardia sp. RS11V-5]|uniref:TetR/AcrR family transcriptional regulator n=1 Tax=Pseudonocardia terrae TaxID=2905831 RepID=UPI001E2E3E5F|nr:TetR/AcrR family transcriptional regulator [Pseudonocardia terrae]MCE3554178.1 TetR/AcrR family transcriptional regulator [Pseudonocardia terrae]
MKRDGRSVIVEAALAGVEECGWEATSMQAVRERAGVSNGSLFHHFPTRADLAAAVVAAGLADHREVLLQALRVAEGAEDGVRRTVVRHLRWIDDNPRLARLFLHSPPDVLQAILDEAARDAHRGFADEISDWLRGHGWPGTPELAAVVALWIGPVHEYARGRLASSGPTPTPTSDALAEGAWRAIRPLLPGIER